MDRRAAMREAHLFVASMIEGIQTTLPDRWSDDEAEHEKIDQALTELAHRHRRAAGPSQRTGGRQ